MAFWHSISIRDILKIERQDQYLLRQILYSCHSKTPSEFLYLETATLKIRFILAVRRKLYQKDILEKNYTETIKKVYCAQKKDPKKGNFVKLLEEDAKMLKFYKNNEETKNIDKEKLKNELKMRATVAFIEHLFKTK